MDPYPYLSSAIACLIAGALLALGRTALTVLPDNAVKRMTGSDSRRERQIAKLLSHPVAFLAGMELGLLTCIGGGSILLWESLQRLPLGSLLTAYSGALGLLINILFFAFVVMTVSVFCYLLPGRVGAHHAKTLAPSLVPLCAGCILLMAPFIFVNRHIAEILGGVFGVPAGESPNRATEEEIRLLVDMGNEKGEIEKSEKEMINNIFEFDDRAVSEIMTHRTDLVAVPIDAPLEEIVSIAMESGYSRIPVYNNGIDDIEGILYVKDLLCLIGRNQTEFTAKNYMRKVLYIPENVSCVDLFTAFKQKKLQVAVAVDEYGGTAGLITMEDLLESIVGNIQDEYDDEDEEIYRISEDCYLLDGTISIDDVESLFDVELDGKENSQYDTIGGMLTEVLDRLPEPDEHPTVLLADILFTVVLVEERRIARIRAERCGPEAKMAENEKKEKE